MFYRANLTVFCEINSTHIDAVWAEGTVFRRVRKIFEKRLLPSSCLPVCPSVRMEQL
jgi:hypothetical protein